MNTKDILRYTLTLIFVVGSVVCLSLISYGVIKTIYDNEFSNPIEYSYKNFSEHDIELAMRYHGVSIVTITEHEVYFVNKDNVKVPLFTDGCIKYLYENKQKEVKNEKK